MRKLLLSLLFTLTCLAAYGQKNEASLFFGPSTNGYVGSYYDYYYHYRGGSTLQDLYEPSLEPSGSSFFYLEYLRDITSRFKAGLGFHYGWEHTTRTPGLAFKDDPTTVTRHSFSLSPHVRYDYIRGSLTSKGSLGIMYLKVLAGAGLRTGGIEDTEYCFDYGIYPLGFQIVVKDWVWSMEIGYGTLYSIHFGVGHRF